MTRTDGRPADGLRDIKITRGFLKFADGSVLMEAGNTRVICSATVEETVPSFLKGKGKGWVTAEYAMLPRSSQTRIPREAAKGRQGGRTHEIQRLVGRSLRAVVDMARLGERTIIIDCDVIQADGGTRTASITGSYVALFDAVSGLIKSGAISANPLIDSVAAVSVGIVDGTPILDLNYEEDSSAEVDMNVVMTGGGKIIEVQGTAEAAPFSKAELNAMLTLAEKGIAGLIAAQKAAAG